MLSEHKNDLINEQTILKAQNLLECLQNKDLLKAQVLIGELNEIRHDDLYTSLGKLTRSFHDALGKVSDFQDGFVSKGQMTDTKSKLDYVIALTEEAANKTMDGIDKTIPISKELTNDAKELYDYWYKFKCGELDLEQFKKLYEQMMVFLGTVELKANAINNILHEVLLAQNYQDLSGQAIKKVINTLVDLENSMVKLLSIAAEARSDFDCQENNNVPPSQTKKTEESNSLQNQDQVDDLLTSLGFE